MIQRSMPTAIPWRRGDRRPHISPRPDHRIPQRHPLGQSGGDGGGGGASRSMRVPRRDARRGEGLDPLRRRQQVGQFVPRQVPAFQQHGGHAKRQQRHRRDPHLGHGANGHARQGLGLRQVGREYGGHRQQPAAERVHRLGGKQRVPALGDHHRIDDQGNSGGVTLQRPAHGCDHLRRAEHTGFHHVGADVGQHGFHLPGDEIQWHGMDAMHAQGVLGGQRGQRGRGEASQRGDGFDVGLNARSASGVRARDDQYAAFHWGEYLKARKAGAAPRVLPPAPFIPPPEQACGPRAR